MESRLAAENINNKNGGLEDEFDTCAKACLYEAVISGGYIKQEPCDTEDKPENTHNYVDVKDDKVCVYETVIRGGYHKQDPCDTTDQPRHDHNYASIKNKIIDDLTIVKQETACATDMKEKDYPCCEGCGEEYDLYCLKCPMLIRIFDGNNSDLSDDDVMRTLPKNFVDIRETQSGVGIVTLRAIPKGVVFGPFEGLDLTKDDTLSKLVSRNKELVYAKDLKCSNWMQYIQRVDQSSHPNLTPFQFEDGLYYCSDSRISMGDELLACWDNDREDNASLDSCFKPRICESIDSIDTYACMLCCVGYKSICHLAAHNSRCPRKRDQNDFCKEIIQCAFCKIYLDKEEYSNYHIDRCCKRNTKISALDQDENDHKPFACSQCPFKTNTNRQLRRHIVNHSDDKPFACSICSYKATTSARLKRHVYIHNDHESFACTLCSHRSKTQAQLTYHMHSHNGDKPFGCTQCPYKTKIKGRLTEHMATHNGDKPFACTLCPFKSRTNSHLKRHIARHNDDKPFACSLCPYKTKTKSLIERHMSKHTDDKLFVCPICSLEIKTKRRKRHMLSHNNNRPYACAHCPYNAKTKERLKQHIAIHKDDKPYACPLCPFKSRTNSYLKTHLAIHKDEKPFTCTQCPFKTRTNSVLTRHRAIHSKK